MNQKYVDCTTEIELINILKDKLLKDLVQSDYDINPIELQNRIRNLEFINKFAEIIKLSLMSKQHIIEEDEYEANLRRVLNYGHSFGHALESITKNTVTHGYAILFGMDLINYLGTKWRLTPPAVYLEFKSLIQKFYPDYKISINITAADLLKEIAKDKKMVNGKMNFAVLKSPGNLEIVEKELDSSLRDLVADYLKNESIFRTT